jgi:hypothetical protein
MKTVADKISNVNEVSFCDARGIMLEQLKPKLNNPTTCKSPIQNLIKIR